MRNTIASFVKARGLSVYRFRKETGIGASTAYDLVNDPTRIPNADVMDRICTAYQVQPGEFIEWVPPSERETSDRPNADEATDGGKADE